MRTRTTTLIAVAMLAGAGLLWAQTSTPPVAQEHAGHHAMTEPEAAAPPASGSMMDECKAMMEKHRAAMGEMEEMDAALDALVAKMNAARGDDKVAATAAAVTELVAQRRTMVARMQSMHPMMMQHMMKHMRSGMMEGSMESMAACPMMGAAKPAEGGHEAHH
jgi:hypothetical protein